MCRGDDYFSGPQASKIKHTTSCQKSSIARSPEWFHAIFNGWEFEIRCINLYYYAYSIFLLSFSRHSRKLHQKCVPLDCNIHTTHSKQGPSNNTRSLPTVNADISSASQLDKEHSNYFRSNSDLRQIHPTSLLLWNNQMELALGSRWHSSPSGRTKGPDSLLGLHLYR